MRNRRIFRQSRRILFLQFSWSFQTAPEKLCDLMAYPKTVLQKKNPAWLSDAVQIMHYLITLIVSIFLFMQTWMYVSKMSAGTWILQRIKPEISSIRRINSVQATITIIQARNGEILRVIIFLLMLVSLALITAWKWSWSSENWWMQWNKMNHEVYNLNWNV